MKTFAFAAGLAVIAGTAVAQYYPAPPAPYYGGGGYHQPRYRTVCHQEPRRVCDYYGYCRVVYHRVCRQVSY